MPEKDLCSVLAPYFLQQRDTLRHHVQKQEAKNQELAEAVLAGRRRVEELQQQVQARQQAWQASVQSRALPSISSSLWRSLNCQLPLCQHKRPHGEQAAAPGCSLSPVLGYVQ